MRAFFAVVLAVALGVSSAFAPATRMARSSVTMSAEQPVCLKDSIRGVSITLSLLPVVYHCGRRIVALFSLLRKIPS
jgi:hypothetical protein